MSNGEYEQTSFSDISHPQDELVTLSHNMYAEGSLGKLYFPELLEGRQRPNIFVASALPYTKAVNRLFNRRLEDNVAVAPFAFRFCYHTFV